MKEVWPTLLWIQTCVSYANKASLRCAVVNNKTISRRKPFLTSVKVASEMHIAQPDKVANKAVAMTIKGQHKQDKW